MSKNPRKILIASICVLAFLVGLFLTLWFVNMPETFSGAKEIGVTVISKDGLEKQLTVETDAEFLRDALEPEGIIAGEESDFGLFVKTVDGYTVDDANQEWWSFTKGGEYLETGVETTPIADGDNFEITLTIGY